MKTTVHAHLLEHIGKDVTIHAFRHCGCVFHRFDPVVRCATCGVSVRSEGSANLAEYSTVDGCLRKKNDTDDALTLMLDCCGDGTVTGTWCRLESRRVHCAATFVEMSMLRVSDGDTWLVLLERHPAIIRRMRRVEDGILECKDWGWEHRFTDDVDGPAYIDMPGVSAPHLLSVVKLFHRLPQHEINLMDWKPCSIIS